MWIETDKKLKEKILALNDANELLAWGNLLYRGDKNTPRDLDLAVECFLRVSQHNINEAIHRLYFIDDANAAAPEDAIRIKQRLSGIDPYKCTVRMLSAQTGKDLHRLILNDAVNSKDWQLGFERLRSAAEKK